MSINLIFKTPTGEVEIPVDKATPEQLVLWINQATSQEDRNTRKLQMYMFLYGAGPRRFRDAYLNKK